MRGERLTVVTCVNGDDLSVGQKRDGGQRPERHVTAMAPREKHRRGMAPPTAGKPGILRGEEAFWCGVESNHRRSSSFNDGLIDGCDTAFTNTNDPLSRADSFGVSRRSVVTIDAEASYLKSLQGKGPV